MPSSGAYLGSWVAPRNGESVKDAIARVEGRIGRRFTIDHQYYRWNQAIPLPHQSWDVQTGRIPFVNWAAATSSGSVTRWSAIANGSQDAWIRERADAFRAFGSPIYLTFHHEPEDDLSRFGTPADYAAAFRRIVTVFRGRGVSNVAFVWTLMSWTFDSRSGRDVNSYYPGDSYVDFVGSDGYNWYPRRANAKWDPFQAVFQPTQDFSVAHGKPWIAVEYGVQEDPAWSGRKGQWFRDALATAKAWPQLKALIYYDEVKEGYPWVTDSSSSSMSGYAEIGRDPYLNGGAGGGGSGGGGGGTPTTTTTLRNSLDTGPDGAPVVSAVRDSAGDPFTKVTVSPGSSLTYDDSHALGRFAARHVLGSRGDATYQWEGTRSVWYGRVYVWMGSLPPSNLRLIRGSTTNVLRCALDIMPDGTLRWLDQYNAPIASTTARIMTGRWIRLEWKVDHTTGTVTIRLYNDPASSTATQMVTSSAGRAIGSSAAEFQFGRSGSQPFTFTFWTDGPALSSTNYLGTT
jgi:hypothetical protein